MPSKPRQQQDTKRYFIDNTFLRGGWGAALGPYAIAVYNAIALHANTDQQAWPSHATIAKLTGMSTRQVMREIENMTSYNIVSVQSRRAERKPAIIILLDKSGWKPFEHMTDSHMLDEQHVTGSHKTGSHKTGSHKTSDRESYEHMTGSHTNKTHETKPKNKPNISDIPPAIPERQFSPKQQMTLALADLCHINLKIASDKQIGQLDTASKALVKDVGNPSQFKKDFRDYWEKEDWRGQKGQSPIPAQVREVYGDFSHWIANGKISRNGANHGSTRPDSKKDANRRAGQDTPNVGAAFKARARGPGS